MKNKYAYFIGCTIPFRASNYDLATKKVAEKLDIELVDLPDAGCCGPQCHGHVIKIKIAHCQKAARDGAAFFGENQL